MEPSLLERKKLPIKGGGVCIYCGWDGGERGLGNEHIIPYSLGGNVELENASCSRCEGVTSYLDGYLANAVFGHLRVHLGLQSRSGHPDSLPVTLESADGEKVIDLATKDHPYFLNMPLWNIPGVMRGAQMSDGFGPSSAHVYHYLPPNIRYVLGINDGEIVRLINATKPPNLRTFARGLAKIGYCDAVRQHGLDGFRHLATPDIILGKYPNIAYFVGSHTGLPPPPYPAGLQHSVNGAVLRYNRLKLLVAWIRIFGDSGTKENGMPFYGVVFGAEGKRKIIPRQPLRTFPRVAL